MVSVGLGEEGRLSPFKHDCASSHWPSGLAPGTEKTQDQGPPLYHPNRTFSSRISSTHSRTHPHLLNVHHVPGAVATAGNETVLSLPTQKPHSQGRKDSNGVSGISSSEDCFGGVCRVAADILPVYVGGWKRLLW